ncbi:hypothetical protein A9Q87_08535 [Flavobacteriales bacterium 34_180_T64]|nr:hypothetical protein A9Q87_08535 [Flavobacteriales bacterium 34_180_T64]
MLKNRFILAGIVSGLVFASLLEGFSYYNNATFSALNFVSYVIVFGGFNGYLTYRAHKNAHKK